LIQTRKEENTMKIECRRFLAAAIFLFPLVFISTAMSQEENAFQWFVFSVTPPQSAMASDGSKILVTGSGTFLVGEAEQVTGGGTWATFNASGVATGSGKFQVTRFVKFDLAPGSVPGQPTFHAGLAFLRIVYDDGGQGVLVVGCNLGPTSPPSVPEGFSASKGFVDYWNGFNGPTLFVAIPGEQD
jgi:hypothetical protein